MRKSLQDWVEAALVVADSNGMSGDEVIPTWPELIVEKYPDFYPELTIGALRDWQVGRAQIAEARAIVDQVVAELEAGFVRCERCGDQEDTATFDCMGDLRKVQCLLSASQQPSGEWVPSEPTDEMLEACLFSEQAKQLPANAKQYLRRVYLTMLAHRPNQKAKSAYKSDR